MDNEGDDANSDESAKLDAILREVAGGAARSPPATDDLLGAVLGHYRVLARLGQGGMGVVYRAEDVRLRREVALKVLPSSVASDAERRRRFVREARSAAAAHHPNIATVFEAGEADGRAFLAMELIEGETLRAKLRRGRVGVHEAVRIARALGQGLAKAHEKNIVHRDLKPENVMLTTEGAVKILDFGLAKLRSMDAYATTSALEQQDTESHADERVMGTPGYMAPEQVTGREVDARCDVFALGVVLYEMVTGALPFEGETPAERVAAVLRDEATSPTSLNAEVGGALGRVIACCLRKRREDRFASAQAFLEALGELGDGASSRRGVISSTSRAMGWGFAALAVAAVAGVYLPRIGRTRAAAAKSTSPPGPAAATTRATTMMDLPPPPTPVVEAAREYALGMGALHDDNGNASIDHFERAVQLDPSMGAAHLRTAIAYYLTTASPDMLGHSAGGWVAIEYALTHPGHLRGLVLSNTNASVRAWLEYTDKIVAEEAPPDVSAKLRDCKARGDGDCYESVSGPYMQKRYLDILPPLDPSWPAAASIACFGRGSNEKMGSATLGVPSFEMRGTVSGWDRWNDLGRIETPTLVLASRHDIHSPTDEARMAARIPGAKLAMLERGSHMAMYDNQEGYFGALMGFLESVEGRRGAATGTR